MKQNKSTCGKKLEEAGKNIEVKQIQKEEVRKSSDGRHDCEWSCKAF